MFKDTFKGKTFSCTHENSNKSGICDSCLKGSKRRVDFMKAQEYNMASIEEKVTLKELIAGKKGVYSKILNKVKCPNCESDKYCVSIFGSICPECFYESKK